MAKRGFLVTLFKRSSYIRFTDKLLLLFTFKYGILYLPFFEN